MKFTVYMVSSANRTLRIHQAEPDPTKPNCTDEQRRKKEVVACDPTDEFGKHAQQRKRQKHCRQPRHDD